MKKTLLTLGAVALFTTPSLFAAQNSLQEHFQTEQRLQKQYQQRLQDGGVSAQKYQYKYQNEYQYKNTGSSRLNMGSFGGQRSGGGRH